MLHFYDWNEREEYGKFKNELGTINDFDELLNALLVNSNSNNTQIRNYCKTSYIALVNATANLDERIDNGDYM